MVWFETIGLRGIINGLRRKKRAYPVMYAVRMYASVPYILTVPTFRDGALRRLQLLAWIRVIAPFRAWSTTGMKRILRTYFLQKNKDCSDVH